MLFTWSVLRHLPPEIGGGEGGEGGEGAPVMKALLYKGEGTFR